MNIEDRFLAVENAAHGYATAAQKVDASEGSPQGDVEPFGKLQTALRAAMLAVHVEACDRVLDSCHVCCPYGKPCLCDECCACNHGSERVVPTEEEMVTPIRCGTKGRYCDRAKEIQELGR